MTPDRYADIEVHNWHFGGRPSWPQDVQDLCAVASWEPAEPRSTRVGFDHCTRHDRVTASAADRSVDDSIGAVCERARPVTVRKRPAMACRGKLARL